MVLDDSLNVKGWIKRVHQLKFKHMNPRAWKGELNSKNWFAKWYRRDRLMLPNETRIWFWAKFWETISSTNERETKRFQSLKFQNRVLRYNTWPLWKTLSSFIGFTTLFLNLMNWRWNQSGLTCNCLISCNPWVLS